MFEDNFQPERRNALKCMAWAGTGLVWAMKGGVLSASAFGAEMPATDADFTFVQVSDSHVGFNKGVYSNVLGTFQTAGRLQLRDDPGHMAGERLPVAGGQGTVCQQTSKQRE